MPSVGVLGTGQVGQAIARRAAEVGYRVVVGARTADSPSLAAYVDDEQIATGTFGDAARSASLLVNATNGLASLEVLTSIGPAVLQGKVIVDVANELAPVPGGFPTPVATADSSLGARLQAAFPQTYVVKALNTMNNEIMVRPDLIPGDHLVFLCGDDAAAKAATWTLLQVFGWRESQLMDLGGIDAAGAMETMMAIWMRVTLPRGSAAPRFNWAALSSSG